MNQNWNDIKKQIREREEALTPEDRKAFAALIGSSPGFKRLFIAIAALFLLGFTGITAYYMLNKERSIQENPKETISHDVEEADQILENNFDEQAPISGKETITEVNTEKPIIKRKEAGQSMVKGAKEAVKPEGVEDREVLTPLTSFDQEFLREPGINLTYKAFYFPLLKEKHAHAIRGVEGDTFVMAKFPKAKKWELRLSLVSTYTLVNENYNNDGLQHKNYQSNNRNSISPGLGYDIRVELKYDLFGPLKLGGGLEYRTMTTQANFNYRVDEIPVIDSASGQILSYLPASNPIRYQQSGNNTYNFLSLPVSLYYAHPIGANWALSGEAIYNMAFLIDQRGVQINKTSLELEDIDKGQLSSYSSSYQIRMGLIYKFRDNLHFALEPSYRKSINDFIKEENRSWKPGDISLGLTSIIKF